MAAPPSQQTIHYLLQVNIAKSFAASYRYNPRNLEAHWYGLWQFVLTHLIGDRDDFCVIPQFPLFHIDQEGDDEYREAGEILDTGDRHIIEKVDQLNDDIVLDSGAPLTKDVRPPVDEPVVPAYPKPDDEAQERLHAEMEFEDLFEDEVLECGDDPDASMVSTATKRANPKLLSTTVPDFVIFHFGVDQSLLKGLDNFRYRALGGLQVTHSCCPLILENKRSPRRGLRGPQFTSKLNSLISEAFTSLYRQCSLYFEMFTRATAVIAIAASGAHWCYRIVHYQEFEEVPVRDGDTQQDKGKGKVKGEDDDDLTPLPMSGKTKFTFQLWSDMFEIGTLRSKVELEKVKRMMCNMKLQTTIQPEIFP